MATVSMADLLKQAEDAGISSFEPTDGPAELEVIRANGSKTKNGDPKFGFQFKVLGGPDDGKSFWTNMMLVPTKKTGEPNSAGLAMTFRDLAVLGAEASIVSNWDIDSPNINDQVQDATVGTRVACEIQVKQSGDFTNINLRKLRRLDSATAAPAAPAAAPAPDGDKPF